MTHAPERDTYIGRFAPSPTGSLHFGSLLAAVASYVDARHRGGTWLVRMEDLDPPREVPGAADEILRTLERFGLRWDAEVLYQSRRRRHYQALTERLLAKGQAYFCACSRLEIRRRGGGRVYDGYCRDRQARLGGEVAVRLKIEGLPVQFQDAIQGPQAQHLQRSVGDFVIRRKDRLYAYQLAVVADDAAQGVTHVVRGCDLLDSTPRQIYLQRRLALPQPEYAHIPIMVNAQGQKLSKQTFATALDPQQPGRALVAALAILGQNPPSELRPAPATEVLDWAVRHWRLDRVPQVPSVPEQPLE